MQVADYSVFDSLKSWMSEEVSGKERPGLYFTSFHVLYKFGAGALLPAGALVVEAVPAPGG